MKQPSDVVLFVRRLMKLYERYLEEIRQTFGLSKIEITIISFLKNNPTRDTAGDIAQLRMIPKGNVSQGVDSLLQKSLLCRGADQVDRRKIHLALTPRAHPIVQEIEAANLQFQSQIFSGFTQAELEQYHTYNERLIENIIQGLERK